MFIWNYQNNFSKQINIEIKTDGVNYNKLKEKTISVAIAGFALMHLQFRLEVYDAGIFAIGCAGLTFLSEKYIRHSFKEIKWFDSSLINFEKIKQVIHENMRVMIITGCISRFSKTPIIQEVARQIKKGNWIIICKATILAPIVEEIIFRGFLKERIEDVLYLISKHIYPIDTEVQSNIVNISQAIIFGSLHMNSKQTSEDNRIIFISTTLFGFVEGKIKDNYHGTLIPSICLHMINNTSATARLLIFGS